ncbi:type 1 glutamine amidotransferase family protein [Actinophytocola sp.]|jgi:putative intracellular protease/amidase|uniref:type 1 glutamine amidotransferase family protein n=1 Tax=Actinophytocola sp. TaxID=1872138 RepID=UPI002ED97B56
MTYAYLFVLDTLADWEPGFLTAELNSGRMFKEPGTALAVRTVAVSREPITTMGGVRIQPDLALAELTPDDAAVLLLPGADTWAEERHRPAPAKAAEFLAAGVPVGAICGATIALADAGLFDSRPHTSNNLEALKQLAPGYAGADHYVEAPAVTDGDLITGTGTAPLDFARHVLARLDVMSPEALEAWYQLYKTSNPEFYVALMSSLPQPVG